MSHTHDSERSGPRPWYRRRSVRWTAAALVLLVLFTLLLRPDSPAVRLLRQDTTWRSIEQQGRWRVGLDPSFPPFEFLDDSGTPVGYDVDLAGAIAAEWGVEVEIVAIGFDSLQDALIAGRVDSVVSALPYDPRLTKNIAYSAPYFDAGLRLATRMDSPLRESPPAGSTDSAVDELDGHTVAVEWGSNGDMVARQLLRDGAGIEIVSFPTPEEAIAAVEQDRADALLIDYVTLRAAQGAGVPVVAIGPPLDSIPYVIAMPVDAHELQRAVDAALTKLQNDGMMTLLETTWFGPLPYGQSPGNDSTVTTE